MNAYRNILGALILAAAMIFTINLGSATAQGSMNRRQGPPPEAFTACGGKKAGDQAQFRSPHGDTVSGTCESMNGRLVLRPESPPQPGSGQGRTTGPESGAGPYSSPRSAPSVETTSGGRGSYPIVDTGQSACYSEQGRRIACPGKKSDFFGQDAQHDGRQPDYADTGDGTVTDKVTGLVWQKGFEVMGYDEAVAHAAASTLGGYGDWRLPTIKEMYSLILFSGIDASSRDMSSVPAGAKPFMDTGFFDFKYGANGKRIIDTQFMSRTVYTGHTMGGARTVFGVNMADGRIKGYPMTDPRSGTAKPFCVKLVRGNSRYGINLFQENGNGTVTDLATGLMWAKADSKKAMNWKEALLWVNALNQKRYQGYSDWRLPNAKELQSIVDYSRSPDATGTPAIDPVFDTTSIVNEAGQKDYPCFWTGTTHISSGSVPGLAGVYVAFGRAMGNMHGRWMDVHGAGAQRSDPKTGDPAQWSRGRGPQGDAIRIENFVRPVRDANG